MPENLVITWPADQPSDRPSAPQAYQCLLSHFLATLGVREKADCTSMLSSIDSCQNRVSTDQYHLTVSRSQVSTHQGRVCFEVIRWQLTRFQMIAGSVQFFKCPRNKLCLWAALLNFWFQTDFGRENSANSYKQGGQLALLSVVNPWSCFMSHFSLRSVKIWQVSSCGKFMQHLENCLLIAEADRVLCHLMF